MISKVFAIYDSKAAAFLPPFMLNTIGEAERALIELCNDATHNFCKYGDDFTLFELGTFDNSNGTYTLHEAKFNIANLLQYKKQPPAAS